MNILEHIIAGHYPSDSKGRALVPASAGGHVVVCAIDMPGACPILGYRMHPSGEREPNQHANSAFGYYADSTLLLPPPPRKVEVKAWAVVATNGNVIITMDAEYRAARYAAQFDDSRVKVVPLTGSYDEPWS